MPYYAFEGLEIKISVEVHTIYKTGVEVEARHGTSLVALVMYDMLKPIDKNVEISSIKLESKKGGKSDFKKLPNYDLKCAVVVCSDSISQGIGEDTAGKIIIEKLENFGIKNIEYTIIADDFDTIQQHAKNFSENEYNLVIFVGGIGLSPRDVTPDVIQPLLEVEISGIMETAQNYGQDCIQFSMLSRGVAGFINNTLVLTFPGFKLLLRNIWMLFFLMFCMCLKLKKEQNIKKN